MRRTRSYDNALEVKQKSTGKSMCFRQVERILFWDRGRGLPERSARAPSPRKALSLVLIVGETAIFANYS